MKERFKVGALALSFAVATISYGCQDVNQVGIQESCSVEDSYVTVSGHAQRDRSLAALNEAFKAAANNDYDAFMAVAADPYIQHSPDLADGWEPVWKLLINRPADFSSRQMQWLGKDGFLDNGDFLIMFREVNRADGTPPSKIVDLMRFDENGKYAEHWDIRQTLSNKTASGRSETAAASVFTNNPVTYSEQVEEANKEVAATFLNLAFNQGKLNAALKEYVDENYVQHNPLIPDGVEPIKQAFESGIIPVLCYDVQHIAAQNDLVVVHSKVTSADGISAVVDILRIRDGKLVEHWDVVQSVPPDSEMPHSNGMF